MSNHFQIERLEEGSLLFQVYLKHTDGLPLVKNWDKRLCNFFRAAEPFLDDIHNFEVRPDDIWLITHPKCGTTWMTEMLWLLINDFDYKTAYAVDQEVRCTYFEYCSIFPTIKPNSLEVVASSRSPRFIRSHLPMHMLPKGLWTVKPKIIYVARDPKDAAVSMYHHTQALRSVSRKLGSLEEYANQVIKDRIFYDPFWDHILEFWSIRNNPKILFTSFERMKNNLRGVVEQVAKFIEKQVDEDEMKILLDHLSFDKMKNNPTCNHKKETKEIRGVYGAEETPFRFVRKGVVGSHKDELSEETVHALQLWTKEQLNAYGATFDEVLLN